MTHRVALITLPWFSLRGVIAMAKVLQAQLNVGPALVSQQAARAGQPLEAGRQRTGAPTARPEDLTRRLDLDEVLLALQRRAPVATLGPSHWWG